MRKIKDTVTYKTVSIPDPFMDEIKEYVKQNKNYRSVAEFVKEAVIYRMTHVGFTDETEPDESLKMILKKVDVLTDKVSKLEKAITKKSGKKESTGNGRGLE